MTITKKIKKDKYDKVIFDYALLGFYEIKKEEVDSFYLSTFERCGDKNKISYYLSRTKKYYSSLIPSIVPIFVFIGLSILFLTLFIVFIFTNKDETFKLVNYLTFLPLGLIFFLVGSIYSLNRTRKINNYILNGDKVIKAIKEEVLNEIKKI